MEDDEMDETALRDRLSNAQSEAVMLANTLLEIARDSEEAETVRHCVRSLASTDVGMSALHTNPL